MINVNTYAKVRDMIESRRLAAVAEADRRNAEVRLASPEIARIDDELTKTGLRLFRAALGGEDIIPIRDRNRELCCEREAALVAIGYPKDYTEIRYTCPVCSDTGFTETAMCSCMRKAIITENIKASGIGELIEKQNFDNFNLESYRKDGEETYRRMHSVFLKAKTFAENFGKTHGNLLFVGPTGTGKTHLSTAVAKCVIDAGYSVIYDSTQNIISTFEDEKFHSGYGEATNESRKYLECDLLILDDLGTEYATPFAVSCLYNLLNSRHNKGLSTVISTNLSPNELTKRYEDRIYSRIVGSDYVLLPFSGHDHRLSLS